RPITSFLGREDEADALVTMITDPRRRLVTVTGPGGIGKTRLSIQVARQCLEHFRDGVVFVGLADVRDPNLLPGTVAHALGVSNAAGRTLIERIRDMCRDAHLLLVADNLEHILDATPFFAEILAHCQGITILATSRSRLQLSGEHVFEVRPLAIDDAVSLFVERAQALAPDFTVTAETRQDIIDTCTHLDGLPLAIELAAARVPVLPPRAMHDRLGNLMDLLGDGLRDAPDRHRGMRQTIAWSHDLLRGEEQAMFRRLAVFEGGFTLDAAATVAGNDTDALSGISALQASSLVRLRPDGSGTPRFRMLETVREFAWEQLRAYGEEHAARQAHARYFAFLADDTERIWWHTGGLDKLDELEPEMPNIRAALAWLQQTGDVPALLRLAGSLAPMWASRGYSREGRAWLEWGLPRSDGTPTQTVVDAARALSWILNQHATYYRSLVTAQYAFTLLDESDDTRRRVSTLILSGVAGNKLGHPEQAIEWYRLSLDELHRCANEAWAPVTNCIVMNLLGAICVDQGKIEEADAWHTRAQATQQSFGLRFTHAGHAFRGFGEIARARGNPTLALSHFLTAMRYAREARDVRQIANSLGAIAGTLAEMGHYEIAGRLFGAAEAHHERIAYPFVSSTFAIQRALGLPEPWASMYPECTVAGGLRRSQWERTASIRAVTLDADMAQRWWNEGRRLDIEAAVALIPPLDHGQTAPTKDPSGLSHREIDVLRLIAQGYSDREIATCLFISPRTVQNHVQHIYTKIDVSSRSAATRWAMVHDIT
ncbi:MAG TPA: LuxR C-terminal-related transcriptional regulator, partial [Thermomicrobiales bacterium]|nr:LuxR C-terminal-related transcriptional regulator [Thermomicrobiales bacterium]